ncbi:MAG: hypothetical protein MJ105_08615 [Lachnospiraceae bacterium]|nr:hypothetical protein [Lachnospiraceae bacterium]
MKAKRIAAFGLAAVTAMSMVACGGNGDGNSTSGNGGDTAANQGHNDVINIGTWWEQHYDSGDTSLEDSDDYAVAQNSAASDDPAKKAEGEFNLMVAQKKWDALKAVEETYNTKIYWQNLTYEGVKDSINTSILAGAPDCQIYLADTSMAVPAQMNGLAVDLKTILPADHDIFTSKINVGYLDLGDGKACIFYRNGGEGTVAGTYPLGFNLQMLEANNLEDPRDLWEKGEWTWDKFNEYCQILTQDTDGDGVIDQYGYTGFKNETLGELMMSNGATIAVPGSPEGLSSAATGEALQEMYDLYNTYNVCAPYDNEADANATRTEYANGNIGFFPCAAWIQDTSGDYDWMGQNGGPKLDWDVCYVRWPVGPSGNKDTNAGKNATTSSEFYIIPVGVQNPAEIFNAIYDMWNWYDLDTTVRDDKSALNWWYSVTSAKPELQQKNFDVMNDCGTKTVLDFWQSVGVEYDLYDIITGEKTPAQFQETYKNPFQDGLDAYFN